MPRKKSYITVTDQFCGAGGSSLGAHRNGLDVTYAMNHWQLAIETHQANFPETTHDCADIQATHPARYQSTDILITSPSCTNHSIAKGKKRDRSQLELFEKQLLDPAAVRSRATMWSVPEYAEYHGYNIIIVENVVDARKWRMWDAWVLAMRSLGYEMQVVYLNSMFAHLSPSVDHRQGDFAPQSRDRMYIVFHKKGNKAPNLDIRPSAWCPKCEANVEAVQSWKKKSGAYARWGRFGDKNQYVYRCPRCAEKVMPYYYAAANAIDWSMPIQRIGGRKRPLKEKTLARIKLGLEKFAGQHLVMDMARPRAKNNRSRPLDGPLYTQTGAQPQALITPFLMDTLFTSANRTVVGVDEAMKTQTGRQSHALVVPFILGYANSESLPRDVSRELHTIHAGGNGVGLVAPPFMMSYYGDNANHRTVERPLGSLTTLARHALVQPQKVSVEDCGFRMLSPQEIGFGMAFPENYVVLGSKRNKVRQYGNAVTPPAMDLLIERCVESLQ